MQTVSVRQIQRYPIYLKILKQMKDEGISVISSPILAQYMNSSEEQVRKDLQIVSKLQGKPRVGRNIDELICDIETFLGFNDNRNAIIVGCGHLGQALLNFDGFNAYGLTILAGFDTNPNLIGKVINSKKIFPLEKIENLVPRLNVHLAIISCPNDVAQEVTDILTKSGIVAILNFSTVNLKASSDVSIENVDIASSLAMLSHKIKNK